MHRQIDEVCSGQMIESYRKLAIVCEHGNNLLEN